VNDVKRSLLETFAINERDNQKLIESLSDAAWHASPPGGKGRSIARIACHIYNVRLMWLGTADKSAKLSAKLDDEKASRKKRDGSPQREREARAGVCWRRGCATQWGKSRTLSWTWLRLLAT
jgi:uncharacterized damage-inducible protein DinB